MFKILCLTFAFSICCIQSIIACGKKKCSQNEINLDFDEGGKIKAGECTTFKLKANKEYTFNISVDPPKEQHMAFLKALAKKLQSTFDRLDDPSYPYEALYTAIWGIDVFNKIKAETKALIDILKSENPSSVSQAGMNFEYFLGDTFLNDNLFNKVFEFKDNLDTTIHLPIDFKTTAIYQFKYIPKWDENFDLSIYVADMEKKFYQDYFTKSREEVKYFFDTIKTNNFYENELKHLDSLDSNFTRYFEKVKKQPATVLCQKTLDDFKVIKNNIDDNVLLKLMKKNWFQQWIWFNEGKIALNPLPFTDEDLLPKSVKPPPAEAKKVEDYNSLRSEAISILHLTNQLSPTKVNTRVFDSLVIQSNQGYEKFVSNTYFKRSAANEKKATEYQQVFKTINRLSFNVFENKKYNTTHMALYNTSTQKIIKSSKKVTPTIATKWNMEVVGFNLQKGQHFEVKEKNEPIPDQSVAITGLNEAGNALNIIKENFSKVINVGNNIEAKNNVSISNKKIQYNSEGSFGDPTAMEGGSNNQLADNYMKHIKDPRVSHSYRIFFENKSGKLWINVAYIIPKLGEYVIFKTNISGVLYNQITTLLDGAEDCIFDELNTNLIARFKDSETTIEGSKKIAEEKIQSELDEVSNFIYSQINGKINIQNERIADLNTQKSNFGAVKSAYQNMAFILPPRKYLAKTDTTPAYFNSFHPLVMGEKANKKQLTLSVYETENKKLLRSRTDAFKTAPRHWVLPSMGLGYVFNSYSQAEAKLNNGSFEKREEENQLRLMAGLHFYPAGVLMADDRFIGAMGWDGFRRLSIYSGVSFPKPLENIHLGIGADIWAGVKVVGGFHIYNYTAYKLQNDVIFKQTFKYVYNGGFVSLQIEPITFVKLFGILN